MRRSILPARTTLVAIVMGVLASCGPATKEDPNAGLIAPESLPRQSAHLQLSGPVTATVTEVRVLRCGPEKAGDFTSFAASVYVLFDGDWYLLDVIGDDPLPVIGSPNGYQGPGLYSAYADFRQMTGTSGVKAVGTEGAWGVPIDRIATMTVSAGEKTVTIGGADSSYLPRPVLSSSLDLWPESRDATGPAPEPTPSADQVEHVSGSWQCR